MATIYGTSGADDLTNQATSVADTIYGYAPSSPTATQVGTGMFQPVFATSPAGDANRLFIAEKGTFGTALVKVVDLQDPSAAAKTILTLTSFTDGNETGLLGLALHPEFAVEGSPHRGKLYVNYSVTAGNDQVIVEYVFDPTDPAAGPIAPPKTIMTIDCSSSNHRAGWMEFGPDKMLYIATGEDMVASNSQTILNQDGSVNLKGKILRIDVNGDSFPGDDNNNYGIPADNPTSFVNIGNVAQSAIWAVGLRNPWRCSFGPDGTLYIADVGEGTYEEINIGTAGANYGWRPTTGGANGDGPQGNDYTEPAYYYPRSQGTSITGGYIYEGPGEFKDHYIYGDFGNGQIFAIDLRDEKPRAVNITNRISFPDNTPIGGWQLVSFGQDGQGNLYVLGMNGRILRLDLSGSTTDLGDTLAGGGGNDTIYGGGGGDTIHGDDDDDHIYGEADNDILYGDDGADTLEGGTGNDIYYVDAADVVVENEDEGYDIVHVTGLGFELQSGQEIEEILADPNDLVAGLTGNEFGQKIVGNANANNINGNGGQDTLEGGGGNDVYQTDGEDTITELEGGGIDSVISTVSHTLGANVEHLQLDGEAAINGTGNELANEIVGNDRDNVIDGQGVLRSEDGVDTLEGGAGNDTYYAYGVETIIEAEAEGTDTIIAIASNYTLAAGAHIEILKANANSAWGNLTGNERANRLYGNAGKNTLDGGGGDDTLVLGGKRDDYIITYNSDGSFTIEDKLSNGQDIDTVRNIEIFEFSDRKVSEEILTTPSDITLDGNVVTENSRIGDPIGQFRAVDNAGDTHRFELIDNANGRFSVDASGILRVADGVRLDYEQAIAHNITVKVTDGSGKTLTRTLSVRVQDSLNETATGSALADLIKGGSGKDVFSGGAGNDTLDAGAGNDRLTGDDGNDRLIGGLGQDSLTGGKGRDVFVFDDKETGSSKSKADYITDFKGKEGDRIDLKLVDADAKKRGDQKFAFIGEKAFTKAGQVRYEKTKKETFVYLNTDNDKAAEAVIKLKGAIDLSKGWFVL